MIKIEHLSKKYNDLVVLRDINAEIKQGEIISIIGPSGTGKSTFLRCLNLLEIPTKGKITIDGVDILDKHADVPKLRQKMGMVFQSFNLFAHLTVLDNLTIGQIKLLRKSRHEAEKRGRELLKLVGLSEKADYFAEELSGGQKQRVAIARCLSMDPEIILFDEPTSALDPTMISEVLAVIRRLAKDGMTMAIVTHEMDFARDVSNRIFYMDEGLIYEEGTPQQIFKNPQKEKTRVFINRIKSFSYRITGVDYDMYAMNAEIEHFCEKHVLPRETTRKILLLSEELIEYHKTKIEKVDLELSISYSEKHDNLEIIFCCDASENLSYSDDSLEDDLGFKIIRNLSEQLSFSKNGNRNQINLTIRK